MRGHLASISVFCLLNISSKFIAAYLYCLFISPLLLNHAPVTPHYHFSHPFFAVFHFLLAAILLLLLSLQFSYSLSIVPMPPPRYSPSHFSLGRPTPPRWTNAYTV